MEQNLCSCVLGFLWLDFEYFLVERSIISWYVDNFVFSKENISFINNLTKV